MTHPVINVLVAIGIPFVRAIGAVDEERERLHTPVIVGHTIGEKFLGALKERLGGWEGLGVCFCKGAGRYRWHGCFSV
jgi:hypothetical protein